jgi:hypothetical protein
MYELLLDPTFRPKADVLLRSEKPLDQFIAGFCFMEQDMVFPMLEQMYRCNNTTTEKFYDQLIELFAYCERKGDKHFRVYTAMCRNEECNTCDKRGFVFVANHTGNFIALIFTMENDTISSFKECVSVRTPVALKPGTKRLYLSEDPF